MSEPTDREDRDTLPVPGPPHDDEETETVNTPEDLTRERERSHDHIANLHVRIKELEADRAHLLVERLSARRDPPDRTLADMAEFAAGNLPDNYEIILTVERHSGHVSLFYAGEKIDYPSNHGNIEEAFGDALSWAIDHPRGRQGV